MQIDWSHPLARGLLAAWLPRGGVLLDVTGRGNDITPNNQPQIVAQAGGLAAIDASSGQHHWRRTLPAALKPAAAVSVFWCGEIRGTGTFATNGSGLLGASYDNVDGSPFTGWSFYRSNSDPANGGFNWNNGSYQQLTYSGVYTTNRRVALLGSVQLGGNATVYADGGVIAGPTAASSGTIIYASTALLIAGAHPTNLSNNSGCGMEVGAVWDRALTQAEAAWLAQEPYCYMLPEG
ncbi:MAG: hypothetical protein K2X74_00460 [Acetobacteraceae bacterium]|nr:hypothetical protein [Acetobacteraceae bacterium]